MNLIDRLIMKCRGDGGGQVTLKNKFRADEDVVGFTVVALLELQERSKAGLNVVFQEASSLAGNDEPPADIMVNFLGKLFLPVNAGNNNKKVFQTMETAKLKEFYQQVSNTVISASRRHPCYGWQLVSPVDYLDFRDWRRKVLQKQKKATT